MSLGASLSRRNSKRVLGKIEKLLNFRPGAFNIKEKDRVFVADSEPTDNSALFDPGRAYVFAYDPSLGAVYFCNSYTNATTHTWVLLS